MNATMPSLGALCTEQYVDKSSGENGGGPPKLQQQAETSCYSISTRDGNVRYNLKAVNGIPVLNVLLHHEVLVDQSVSGVFAYLCVPNGTLLRTCNGDRLPCALNSTLPIRGGFKDFGGFYEPYWTGFESYVNGTCTSSSMPAFETFVSLCSSAAAQDNCQGQYSVSQNPVYNMTYNLTYNKEQRCQLKFDFDFAFYAPLNNSTTSWYKFLWLDNGQSVSRCSNVSQDNQFAFCSGNQVFTQHLVSTLDLPFSDVDNLANEDIGGSNYVANKSQWYWQASNATGKLTYVPAGSVVRSLFSAYVCYPGLQNQPPKFVNPVYVDGQFFSSSSRKFSKLPADYLLPPAETEKLCYVNSTCTLELVAQDFLVGSSLCADPECQNFDDVSLSEDVVQIELITEWTNWSGISLSTAHCESDSKRPCVWDSDCLPGDRCTGYQPDSSIQPFYGHCCDASMPCLSGAEPGTSRCIFDSDCPPAQQCVKPRCESNSNHNISGALKCYYTEFFSASDAGKVVQRCFIAKDPHGDKVWTGTPPAPSSFYPYVITGLCDPRLNPQRTCNVAGSEVVETATPSNTCSSYPVCFKIRIESNPPQFVHPTPLESNSLDEQGNPIPNQTDVAACEGYPIDLIIKAEDPDVGNNVRIFLHDFEIDTSVATSQDLQWMQTVENSYNFDFFSNRATPQYPPQCSGNPANDSFHGYDAYKVGVNAQQESILPLDGSIVKSVVSGYAQNVEYSRAPNISVHYTLEPSKRNGIILRLASATSDNEQNCRILSSSGVSYNGVSCRESILNMDQVICAYAYDDSRYQSKRWVGKRNPNSHNILKNLRDHSDGDMSTRHCWRVVLQAPPRFVTTWSTYSSSISPTCDLSAYANTLIRDSEVGKMLKAYNYTIFDLKCVGVGEDFSFEFVAQDPNRQDLVQIFILDDPGMPPGMRASQTYCVIRSPETNNPMCGATRIGEDLIRLDQNKSSRCSKAMLRLAWSPFREQLNRTFFVCARAQDSSTACVGKNRDATSRGWYGETACVELAVVPPVLSWQGYMVAQPDQIDVFVGCTVTLSISASAGQHYVADIGFVTKSNIKFSFSRPVISNAITSRVFVWRPSIGTEGSVHTVSFYTNDSIGIREPLWKNLVFSVQKCQYCIGNDILTMTHGLEYTDLNFIARYFNLEINWLHIWLLNGNRDAKGDQIFNGNPNYFQFKRIPQVTLNDFISNVNNSLILWLASRYKYRAHESLATIATSLGSSLKTLLKLNPDVQNPYIPLNNQSSVHSPYVCVLPCT
ncbi:hypothetical protein GUITHDRAFT_102655 [Guillardia theta CCMP2712]|uniref:Uncharacterized protein n=1 Tax=Guillardia theta (strain CCMP2712) TaxID=905079 RepID=L1JT75_GUITC|nr:hypothetical protein GUITHDRAFT_102655 [Guillardia theta CCMP2712]EKX51385.1 hypothetical protein GUITHDRAFT_102655 [Guillardia theta CCMP2712]|eukprot:XP_005838365.1 hypothetical protein GUITHDRAFT_102655 [Guillardia theta CCMP2712]